MMSISSSAAPDLEFQSVCVVPGGTARIRNVPSSSGVPSIMAALSTMSATLRESHSSGTSSRPVTASPSRSSISGHGSFAGSARSSAHRSVSKSRT